MKRKTTGLRAKRPLGLPTAIVMALSSGALLGFVAFPRLPEQLGQVFQDYSKSRALVEFQKKLANDPLPGTQLRLPRLDVTGAAVVMAPLQSVHLMGNLNVESASQLDDYLSQLSPSALEITPIVVAICDRNVGRRIEEELTQEVRLIIDEDETVHRSWNAFFVPRVYLLDHEGALIAASTTTAGGACDSCGS